MRCVIVAAGRGSRLGPLTAGRPKCLVPFLGEPLLSRTIDILGRAGVTDVTIVGGYRHDDLLPVVAEDGCRRELLVNEEWQSTNMVRSLMCASHRLASEPCLISYSDIFYSEAIVCRLLQDPSPIRVAYDVHGCDLWQARFADPLSDIENFVRGSDGRLLRIGGRVDDIAHVEGQYMGLLGTTPEGFARMVVALEAMEPEVRRTVDMTSLLSAMLARGDRIATVPNDEPWGELDSPEDIAFFEARSADYRHESTLLTAREARAL